MDHELGMRITALVILAAGSLNSYRFKNKWTSGFIAGLFVLDLMYFIAGK